MDKVLKYKLERLGKNRKKLRTADLFAGCGGFSLGFHRASFDIVCAVEKDRIARDTHERNFGGRAKYRIFSDITKIKPEETAKHISAFHPKRAIDVIIGGPPCQAYATIGRPKLRSLNGSTGHKNDERANLYHVFLHFVRTLKPLVFVMENVKEIMSFDGVNIAEEIAKKAERWGYRVKYSLLNSAWFGVPQFRERVILIGYHHIMNMEPAFPNLSHKVEIPEGYTSSSKNKIKSLAGSSADSLIVDLENNYYSSSVSCKDALEDLPVIKLHFNKPIRGKRNLDKTMPYSSSPVSSFAREMRRWPGFERANDVNANAIRYTPRDFPIFRRMKPGDQYPEAHRIAVEELLSRNIKKFTERNGRSPNSKERKEIKKKTVPPYDPNKFPNKWWKMEHDKPARTLTAHLGKDTYSHIHYDSEQARAISVREAARLQSFPDDFGFEGGLTSAFRQIGNAVPPLMAFAIGHRIQRDILKMLSSRENRTVIL